MDAQFWLERWQRGETGFNQPMAHPALDRFWPTLRLPANTTVFVPLAGKSVDMVWLAEQGHRVVGVELAEIAVREFFAERGLTPERDDRGSLARYVGGPYTLWQGDIFALTPALLGNIAAVFDRAALIALPLPMRARYVRHLEKLTPAGTPTLLVTLEYDQSKMAGPPHSVLADEVHSLYSAGHSIDVLAHYDQLADMPRFRERGLDALTERIYRLQRH